jgi:hypothetical protein
VSEPAPDHPEQLPENAVPDLEALLKTQLPLDVAAIGAISTLTAVHWAWYEWWKVRGFTEGQAFELVRIMVREGSRRLSWLRGSSDGKPHARAIIPVRACALTDPGPATRLAIFGSVDGLTMFLGLVLGLIVARQSGTAAWHAALGGGAGELAGMTAGQYISDRASGLRVAAGCGLAGAAACIAPGIPFAFLARRPALIAALVIAAVVGAGIAWLRPERGLQAIGQTYGVLVAAGVLSGLTGLI